MRSHIAVFEFHLRRLHCHLHRWDRRAVDYSQRWETTGVIESVFQQFHTSRSSTFAYTNLFSDSLSSSSGRNNPSAFKYSMKPSSRSIIVAFGVIRLNFGYHDLNAHASTALRVSGGKCTCTSRVDVEVEANGACIPLDMVAGKARIPR